MNLQSIPLDWYLLLAAALFTIGVVGVVTRRNAIIIFMAIEMMLNSVNLVFVSLAQFMGDIAGQVFVLFVMAIAAGEAAIGLAIVLALFRNKRTVYVDEVNVLKW
ncbi:MAG: NADH-quinone oxidoreductase subunit NuoK [Bacteroidota bacterium]|nr:NADH-quinone oxidoreductase subunit NuoK [Candidatus Kapabacteria bacterium]MCS7301987.1 NADH-quinone oxidoreductase subunit NuoK [Candidatus Kapabacteria bacterium]MCX7936557.1 NADH-quinone oxidoreductase subunit NuoK [Chlorobiota bacterium]MDW8074750.1 NADH-quinone oxidoreductase subunit NuoK [Bacteroidota bacterium]MDW8271389.1 NADH-quinone oxidoreductase subunit NuoK [Bacteroidota bacterium]